MPRINCSFKQQKSLKNWTEKKYIIPKQSVRLPLYGKIIFNFRGSYFASSTNKNEIMMSFILFNELIISILQLKMQNSASIVNFSISKPIKTVKNTFDRLL
jgi:hypothetical protein